MQSNSNRNTPHPNTSEKILAKEDKTNVEIIKRTMPEKKTTLPSLKNQD